MPYSSNTLLPEGVKNNLPEHAQDIYREVFNNAWERYEDPDLRRGGESQEEASSKTAWSAVKRSYEKGADGMWRKKD